VRDALAGTCAVKLAQTCAPAAALQLHQPPSPAALQAESAVWSGPRLHEVVTVRVLRIGASGVSVHLSMPGAAALRGTIAPEEVSSPLLFFVAVLVLESLPMLARSGAAYACKSVRAFQFKRFMAPRCSET
jgi:hypothetical protein